MSFATSSDVEHSTRDLGGRIDGEREVRCLLKGAQVIAAERCVEAQKEGCWCKAGLGALRALDALATDTTRCDPERKAWQAKTRIDLVALKARAAGFAKSEQEFAGPALAHMNREKQRQRTTRVQREAQLVEELRQPISPTPAELKAPAPPPSTEKSVSEQIREIPIPPGRPHTVCRGLPGKPCIKILRATSKGDRCKGCHRQAANPDQQTQARRRAPSIEVEKQEGETVDVIDAGAVAEWMKRGVQIRRALVAKIERLSRELTDAKQTLQSLPKE